VFLKLPEMAKENLLVFGQQIKPCAQVFITWFLLFRVIEIHAILQ
jgi:hypothetical protein